ncbi:MAG: DUF721 domain-containing protein [Candidatus Paracaedibacter sp.]
MLYGKYNYNKGSTKRQARTCRVGPLIVDAITPICQQNGFVQARILLEWEYIVTSQFAQFCTPLKVTFPLKQRSNGRLLLRATSSMATEISYLEPLILSRINQYFGYQAITKISLLQGPITQKNPPQPTRKPLSEAIQSSLENHVQPIEDDRLRAALLSLGVGISHKKTKT